LDVAAMGALDVAAVGALDVAAVGALDVAAVGTLDVAAGRALDVAALGIGKGGWLGNSRSQSFGVSVPFSMRMTILVGGRSHGMTW
jgi:hypothetical protein